MTTASATAPSTDRFGRRSLDTALLLAFLLATWTALHLIAGDVALPSPAATLRRAWALVVTGTFWGHVSTTMRAYAVDFDGDGRRDLSESLSDVFASAANYLHASGWDGRERWGQEVRLSEDFDYLEAGLEVEKPLRVWRMPQCSESLVIS